jgi:7-cyano-7-deazaguanine reductase
MTQLDNSNISKVLGKTVDYPDQYDPSILVKEPRQSNRKHLNIKDDNLPFCGFDIWNAWEISCLTEKGQPVTAIAKIVYPCESECIVESKSLKLYFNSFNMSRFGTTAAEATQHMQETAAKDLSMLLDTDVRVNLFRTHDKFELPEERRGFKYHTLESDSKVLDELEFTEFNENHKLLRVRNISGYLLKQYYHSSLLKSNCRVTHQPDWGDVYIYIKCNQQLDHGGLAQYIASYRDENHFHEEICETIYTRLCDLFMPKELRVTCLYARRGGIDINPTRASHEHLLDECLIDPTVPYIKTPRQ